MRRGRVGSGPSAFLVHETTIGQRITRAKRKIKAARIPYRVPSPKDLPARLSGVLAALFLVFNEGYLATGPDTDPVRHDLNTYRHVGSLRTASFADGATVMITTL